MSSIASGRFRALARKHRAELDRLMRTGATIRPEEVAGAEYRGWNVARISALILSRKFLKRFRPPDAGGCVFGENVLARLDGLGAPWRPRLGGRGFLPFGVLPPGSFPSADWPQALIVTYAEGRRRSRFNPMRAVVDYLVRPDPQRPDLLLGASRLEFAARPVFLEHFLLERVTI